ncbi:MAG TPA: hypothetical protein VFJ43_17010, partial [Bacteroidia bacterium]|nr:hypothetical protein [Bacteroidia bacterium]
KTESGETVSNRNGIYFTTIKTGKGTTNISITNTGDSVVTKVSGNGKDSTYAYAHSGNSGPTVFVFNDGDSGSASASDNFSFDMNNYSFDSDKLNQAMALQSEAWEKQAEEVAKQSEEIAKQSEEMAEQMSDRNRKSCHVNMAVCGPGANDSLVRKIGEALVADKLITDVKNYQFSIDGNSVKVNGKKLDKAAWEKYKEIIETNSHSKVNRKFKYELLMNGENETINVSNYED